MSGAGGDAALERAIENMVSMIGEWRQKYDTCAGLLLDEMRKHEQAKSALKASQAREAVLQKRIDELEEVVRCGGERP